MSRELIPGRWNRDGHAVPDARNCYMSDDELSRQADAYAKWHAVNEEHSLPSLVWWVAVTIAAVIAFGAGLLLGSKP